MSFEHEDDILGQCDIVFYDMDENVIKAHIGIGIYHSITIFFDQAVIPFDGRSKGFKLLIQ